MHESETGLSRREFLQSGWEVGWRTAVALAVPSLLVACETAKEPARVELETWDPSTFEDTWRKAREFSRNFSETVEIVLPKGEIGISQKLQLDVGKDESIILTGHKEGTILRLSREIAEHPHPFKDKTGKVLEGDQLLQWQYEVWQARDKNLMEVFIDGEITILNLEFDGGSEKAGEGGYVAPLAPWNAILILAGNNEGGRGFRPKEETSGMARVENCSFTRSQSTGVVFQGLDRAEAVGLNGSRLDALVVGNWNRKINVDGCNTQENLSDGYFFVRNQKGRVANSTAKKCRQGFHSQGSENMLFESCLSSYCAEAYTVAWSDDGQVSSRNIKLKNCDSEGCLLAYAYHHVHGLRASGVHRLAGEWWNLPPDLYRTGVARLENLNKVRSPIWHGDTEHISGVKFNSRVEISPNAPSHYQIANGPQPPGVEFIDLRSKAGRGEALI